jgi:hypothetical protein
MWVTRKVPPTDASRNFYDNAVLRPRLGTMPSMILATILLFVACGLGAIIGSSHLGPRMQGWFARPFFVFLGIAFLPSTTKLATILLFVTCGLVAISGGLLGDDFHWKPLGSSHLGPRMPRWFAKPFFVLIGIAFLADGLALCH